MNEKILKDIELKIKNNELKNKEELEQHLTEFKYRGILTQMEVNSLTKELSKSYDSGNKQIISSKRITRTPQNRFF